MLATISQDRPAPPHSRVASRQTLVHGEGFRCGAAALAGRTNFRVAQSQLPTCRRPRSDCRKRTIRTRYRAKLRASRPAAPPRADELLAFDAEAIAVRILEAVPAGEGGPDRLSSQSAPGDLKRRLDDAAPIDETPLSGQESSMVRARQEHIQVARDGRVRKVVRDLSAVFSFAVRKGIVATNPCATAAVRKTDNRRERYLTLAEVRRLGRAFAALEAEVANSMAVDIARLWAVTGCRRDTM
jgi:hypothetical protein